MCVGRSAFDALQPHRDDRTTQVHPRTVIKVLLFWNQVGLGAGQQTKVVLYQGFVLVPTSHAPHRHKTRTHAADKHAHGTGSLGMSQAPR